MSEEKDARWVNPAVMRPVCQAEALPIHLVQRVERGKLPPPGR